MYALKNDDVSPDDALDVDTSSESYTAWSGGQTIFHYTYNGTTASGNVPLIYNNTIYIGPDIENVGLFGHNTDFAVNKYVRFYNNIVLKAGPGTLYLSYGHDKSGNGNGYIQNAGNGFRNNLLWAYDTDPDIGNYNRFSNGAGATIQTLTSTNGNQWKNPKLKIQEAGQSAIFRSQRDTVFPESNYTNVTALETFTGKTRLRSRASLFMPTDVSGLNFGVHIPAGGGSAIDNAWIGNLTQFPGEDFFGEQISNPPVVGASEKAFDSKYDPEE